MVGMLRFLSDINQPSFPTLFFSFFKNSVLVSISVFMAFSTVFHSINSPDNSPLSHPVLPVLFLLYTNTTFMSLSTIMSVYVSLLQP